MDLQLRGKTALVTGASAGIGRGIALALAAEGVRMAVTRAPAHKLDDVADEMVGRWRPRPLIIEQDMMADDAAARIAGAALAGLGRVDILVNNAGGSRSFNELHVERGRVAGSDHAQLPSAAPARRGADRRDDHARLGPHHQHHRQERARPHQRRVLRQGRHAQLGQGPEPHGGAHGITVNCIPPGRIHSEQILRNYTPEYRRGKARTRSRWGATASRRTSPTWCVFSPARAPATSPAR